MKKMLGRFEAYVPDRNLFQDILSILSCTGLERDTDINFQQNRLHSFFFNMKKKYPLIFEDVYFNDNPDFPYSREIADVFTRLQESEFLTRPNPSLNKYRLVADLGSIKINISDKDQIKKIADQFKDEFKIEKGCGRTCN